MFAAFYDNFSIRLCIYGIIRVTMEVFRMKNKLKILVVITFCLMIVVNGLANGLPLNGISTGAISDSYPNLFAPAGITFSIWGVIYLLLGCFTFYQLGIINKNDHLSEVLLNKVRTLFALSSVLNILWLFSWHYLMIPLSMILMIGLLFCLIRIVDAIKVETLNRKEKFFVKLPFSLYFGWITVATIANASVLLVSLAWNRFGIPESVWTSIIIVVGALIGILAILTNKDYFYGLVIIWAYNGIIIKHTTEFQSQYPSIIMTTAICIGCVVIAEIYVLRKRAF